MLTRKMYVYLSVIKYFSLTLALGLAMPLQSMGATPEKDTVILPVDNNKIAVTTIDKNLIPQIQDLDKVAVVVPAKSKTSVIDTVAKLNTVEHSYIPDKNLVAEAAYASMAVYNGEQDRLAWKHLQEEGFKLSSFTIDKNKMLWAQKQSGKGTLNILAIAGTESKAGLKLNINTDTEVFENDENLMAHKGYYRLSKAVVINPIVARAISNTQKSGNNKLVLTGHSLGGATALLSSMLLQQRKLLDGSQMESIIFGTPMIGNEKLAASTANLKYKAYEMNSDFIPKAFQIIYDKYQEYLPGRVKWNSHMPPLTISHAMIMYLDEAELQRSNTYTDDIASEANLGKMGVMYIPAPQIEDEVDLPKEALQAYIKGLNHIAYQEYPQSVVSYQPTTLAEALKYAKLHNMKSVLWKDLKFINNKNSQVRNYHLQAVLSLYDAQTGQLQNQIYHIIKDGGYTLLTNTLETHKKDLHNLVI